MRRLIPAALLLASSALLASPAAPDAPAKARTMPEILEASQPSDWEDIAPEDTLYLELDSGRVAIELAERAAPAHVENIRALARGKYWDGFSINRSQDNFVVQWGDPAEDDVQRRPLGEAKQRLPAEFTFEARDVPFHRLPDADGWAPQVGFVDGFPAARDPESGRAWLAHCYGMVGAGRDMAPDSSNGTELYVVIGHAPRQLDRNITVVGRVVHGIEKLSTLPRGTGPLGFYEKAEQRVPIRSVRLASKLPESERTPLQRLRTGTPLFDELTEARRNRRDDWYKVPAGYIDLCNVPLPVREKPAG